MAAIVGPVTYLCILMVIHMTRALLPGRQNPLMRVLLHNYTASQGGHHLGQIVDMVEKDYEQLDADLSCSPAKKQEEASLEVLEALAGGQLDQCASTVRYHLGEGKDFQGRYNIPFSRDAGKIVGKATVFVKVVLQSSRVPSSVFAVLTVHEGPPISVPLVQGGARDLCLGFDLSCVFHRQQMRVGDSRFPVSVDLMCRYGTGDYQSCGFRLGLNPFVIAHYFHKESDVTRCVHLSAAERLTCLLAR